MNIEEEHFSTLSLQTCLCIYCYHKSTWGYGKGTIKGV